jgi:DNA-binding transcriptional regulator YiaG
LPNIANILKEEISRLARKELRAETESLKKASAQYRAEIAALKRRVAVLEQQVARIEKRAGKAQVVPVSADAATRVRFTAKGLRTLRQRLGLSVSEIAALLEVSAQTIYNWETETTHPRGQQVAAIAALRGIGKREAAARLREATGQTDSAEAA